MSIFKKSLFFFFILVLISCNQPATTTNTSTTVSGSTSTTTTSVTPGTLTPPVSVAASYSNGSIDVSWPVVTEAEQYQIYRKIGAGSFVELNGALVAINSFVDQTFDLDVDLYYAVKSEKGGEYSVLSVSSNVVHVDSSSMAAVKPVVKSFSTANALVIEWTPDAAADEYVLFKDSAYNGTYSTIAYSGTELSYIDTGVTNGQFYYYRLALKKGVTTFTKSDYAYGVAGSTIADNFESNDSTDDSIELFSGSNNANIFYYKDIIDNILLDVDWYHVAVPAFSSLMITFDNLSGINNGDILFNISGEAPVGINNNDDFFLTNGGDVTSDILFRVSVNIPTFIDSFGSYRVIVE